MTGESSAPGVRTTARRIVSGGLSPSLKRRYRDLRRFVRQSVQRAFDLRAGTDTTGVVKDPTGQGKSSGHEYEATNPFAFHRLIHRIDQDLSDFTFIDVGSGKGAVLLYASRHPFRSVIGVEHSPQLHAIAESNISVYRRRGARMRCSDVRSVLQDATCFEWPPAPLVVYLYSPVPRDGIVRILDNLEKSRAGSPRPVFVIALNPYADLYDSRSWLKPVYRGWNNAVIYRSV